MIKRHHIGFTAWLAVLLAAFALVLAPAVVPAAGMEPLSAGIGQDDRAPHPDYPLKLVFASKAGPYLADINVKIYDSSGSQMLETHSPGPWLFVDVPAGTYTVKCMRSNGDVASAEVNVGGDRQSVATLTWKVSG